MRIVQLSDLHLSSQPLYGVVDTLAALQLALRRLAALPAPDLLLLSGDLTSAGRREEYALLRSLLAGLPFPCALLPGNHDDRDQLRAAFCEQAWAPPPLCCQRIDLDGGTLLLLDCIVPGEEWGEVAAPQIDWLESACPQRRPVLLALHHPPFCVGIAGMDRIRCRGDAPLARPAIVAPSPAHQIALQDGPLAYTLEPGGFLLHDWLPGQRLCSHCLPVAASPTQCYGDG